MKCDIVSAVIFMEKKRFENVDICKGILILLVVITHGVGMTAAKEGYFRTWAGSVTMPSFFILSGLMYNHEKWSKKGFVAFVVRRIQTLIIPYFFFELTGGAVVQIILGNWSGLTAAGIAKGFLSLLINAIKIECNMWPDWFLPTLFGAELLLFIALSLEKRKSFLLWVCLIAALIPTIVYVHADIPTGLINGLLWRGTRVLIGFVLLVIGAKGKNLFLRREYKLWQILIAFAVPSLAVLINGRCSMYAMNYRSLFLFTVSGCAGMFFILAVSSKIHSRLLTYIGKGSLILLGTHSIVYVYFYSRSGYLWPEPWSTFFLYLFAVAVIAAITLPLYPKLFPHMMGTKLLWDYHRE